MEPELRMFIREELSQEREGLHYRRLSRGKAEKNGSDIAQVRSDRRRVGEENSSRRMQLQLKAFIGGRGTGGVVSWDVNTHMKCSSNRHKHVVVSTAADLGCKPYIPNHGQFQQLRAVD